MNLELQWRPSPSASCFHAAQAILAGRTLTDEVLERELRPPAAALEGVLIAHQTSIDALFEHLTPLAASGPGNRQLAIAAVSRVKAREVAERMAERLSGLFGSLEAATIRARPDLAEELDLRVGPLREQWEARGPGLWRRLAMATDAAMFVERADVILLHPVLGGAGRAFLPYNSIGLEAVLANPFPELPEVVRMAWLLATLHQDLPRYSENIPSRHLALTAKLALLPAALAAGEEVELTRCDEATLAKACECWLPGEIAPELAPAALDWWQTYVDSRPPWPIALGALARIAQEGIRCKV